MATSINAEAPAHADVAADGWQSLTIGPASPQIWIGFSLALTTLALLVVLSLWSGSRLIGFSAIAALIFVLCAGVFVHRMIVSLTVAIGAANQSAKKTAEQTELLDRTAELARSNAELEQFAYVASHDLQEPLRMIASYLQLLQRRYSGRLDSDAEDFINFAVDGATRMKQLINDLLNYSRAGRGSEPIRVNLNRALARAMSTLALKIEEVHAEISADPLPDVLGDENRLFEVFQNLIGNALKFHGADRPRIRIAARRDGPEWTISVIDNGIGLEPEYKERIFVMFQRLHGRDDYPGTGIGLAICKRVIERLGGRIWVDSDPGKGSAFRFTIRACEELNGDRTVPEFRISGYPAG